MKTQSVIVSFGRNVGTEPMPAKQWQDFRGAVLAEIAARADTVHAVTAGTGVYVDDSGRTIVEDCTIVAATMTAVAAVAVERPLSILAAAYGQESIAVTRGAVSFVRAIADDVRESVASR